MLALILAFNLALVTGDDVQMALTIVKPAILVGESTKARVRWTVKKRSEVLFGSERVLIDDGAGYRVHSEAAFSQTLVVSQPTAMGAGLTDVTEYVIGLRQIDAPSNLSGLEAAAASLQFVFSRPGRYRIKVQYQGAESNEAAVDVQAPIGIDAKVLDDIRRQPLVLTRVGRQDGELVSKANDLIAAYGPHPYLARMILEQIGAHDAISFERLRSLDLSRSAFEDERLSRLAEKGVNYLGAEWQRQALRDLVQRFPDSVAAQKANELLVRQEDTEPPTLAIAPSPVALWPPSGSLEPVIVSVQVSDNLDPSPRVKLTSITCDDGCNPAQDISGATIGADDRQFAVRSKRGGSGQSRSYTITYVAEDAHGNTKTAEATVSIANDQNQPPDHRGSWSGQGMWYRANDLATHDGFTWKCIQAHRSQPDWAPPRTPAMWVKIPKNKEWDYPVQYALNAEVTLNGVTYKCRQAHTSQEGWTPQGTPALWSRLQ